MRSIAAVLAGVFAGAMLLDSSAVGVGFALEGHRPDSWNFTQWGNHWVWRAVASAATTFGSGFLVGMVSRTRGRLLAAIAAVPSELFWLAVAYTGWTGHLPFVGAVEPIPLGYRIVASILAVITLPLSAMAGEAGAPFGRANAKHFDRRRGSLLGVRWYHFLWLPVLVHLMVMTAAFGAVYGSQWLVTSLKMGFSFFAFIPALFYVGLVYTLVWLGTGAMKTYEALAGYDGDDSSPVWKRVLKFGPGYTLGVALAQSAIAGAHYGLSLIVRKFGG